MVGDRVQGWGNRKFSGEENQSWSGESPQH